jgi:integrase
MARQPKPWFWQARNAWYVQVGGKQVKLHEEKKEADREFYRIMAAEGRLDPRQRQHMSVADACEALIANSQHLRAATFRLYTEKLGSFAGQFGGRRLDSVQPQEVIRWIRSYQGTRPERKPYGEASRCLLFRYIKSFYKWARETGLIELDPFVRVPNPWRVMARDRGMTDHEYELVMMAPRLSPNFKELVEFIWNTGIRPGELVSLSARHMDAKRPIARFQPAEHKTGTKTGRQREIHFPADLWKRLQGYAEIHRKGPLLRKANGNPWTSKEVSCAWYRFAKTHGIECVLYQARHRFLTTLGESGVPLGRVAAIAGHSSVDVLLSTYYHPESQQMGEDVDAAGRAEPDRMARIAEKIAAKKEQSKARKRQLGTEWARRFRARTKGEA